MPITFTHPDPALMDGLKADNSAAFAALYDQYSSVILGVITKIVSEETEALALLETTFGKVRLQIGQYQPEKQPLFSWLLNIARCTAADALAAREKRVTPVLQLTKTGKVVSLPLSKNTASPAEIDTTFTSARLKELLDSVLFKNCSPEEAATSLGLPVETARQQLRIAMQQLRAMPSQRIA